MSHALVGLVGQGEATGILLMGRGVQGRFGIWGVRQGALAMACAHGVGGQIPLVDGHGGGRAALLVKHRCRVGEEAGAGVGVRMGREMGVGVRVVVGLIAGVRVRVGEGVALEV